MSAVRVAFVSSHAKLGGAERYLELLLGELGESWVAGIVCLEDGPFVDRLRRIGYDTRVVATGRHPTDLLRAVRPLRRSLRAVGGDVVHANGIKAALVSAVAVRGLRRGLVWVKHDFTGDGALARVAAAGVDQVIGVSSAVVETFGRRSRKIHVVPNAVPRTPIAGDERERVLRLLQAGPTARVVALVGRVAPDKGQHELLAAAPSVVAQIPEVRFAFIGAESDSERAYADELRADAESAGVAERLTFTGFREDAAALVAGCDVVAVPSVRDRAGRGREGFGLVGLEAFSVGTPVVGYDDGALRETLGSCALLVAPGDRAGLAEAIVRVLRDEAEARRLVDCGRRRVEGRYALERLAADMKGRYRAAAKSGGGA